jgi:hypothetical protein
MSPQKKTAARATEPAPTPRTGDPCPGPGEEDGQPCGRPVVAHGLCRGHDRQDQAGQQLRPIRRVKDKSPEGAVYRWGISWSSPEHADAVTAMAKDAGRGERDFIRFVLEERATAEGRLVQPDAPAPKAASAGSRRRGPRS